MNREQRRSETIHRKKLFGGRRTAEEVHQRYAFPPFAKCVCGARPMTRAIVMLPLDEARKRDPMVDLIMQERPEDFFKMLVQIKGGAGQSVPHLRVSTVYACKSCTPMMEKELAKGPSWAIVEIGRGPSPDRLVVAPNTDP